MSILNDDWLDQLIDDIKKNMDSQGLDSQRIEKTIYEAITKAIPEMAQKVVKDIKSRAHSVLSDQRYIMAEFVSRLQRRWFEAFDLLELVIGSLAQIGEELNNRLRSIDEAKPGHTIEVMTRIHARGTRIAREILCLLRNGYADGAFTRWRSLHELSAYQYFIFQSGENTATKYLDYIEIDRYNEAAMYQEHAESLGYTPLSNDEWEPIIRKKENLIRKHGAEFIQKYGWTMDVLRPEKRNFRGIEEAVGLVHLRPFYAMASRSIHSTPKGLFYDLGLLDKGYFCNPLLVGASNYGLADPGQNCAISLLQITTTVGLLYPTVSGMSSLKAVGILIDEMAQKFVAIQTEIEEQEKENDNSTNSDYPVS